MALQDGDVVVLDYVLQLPGSEKPLETSIEAVAQEHGIQRDGKAYRPLTVTLGAHQVIPGLESHVRSHGQVGVETTVDLAATEAYGPRDPSKVKDIPLARFKSQKVDPKVGLVVNVQGERALVARVAGGRVRVDMNHDLAGKDLRYTYTVREILEDPARKAEVLLAGMLGVAPPHTVEDGVVTVDVPQQALFAEEWRMAKFRLVAELRAALGKATTVRFVESFPGHEGDEGHEGHTHEGHSHEGHTHEGHGHEGHTHEGHSHEGHTHEAHSHEEE